MANIHYVNTPAPERVLRCLMRHPDWSTERITGAIHGSNVAMVKEARAKMAGLPTPAPEARGNNLVSLDSLKAKFDTVGAIRRELEKIPRGKLMPEQELRQLACGFDSTRFRRAVDANIDEFQVCRIKVKTERDHEGKWFWGHPDDVAELQQAIDQ